MVTDPDTNAPKSESLDSSRLWDALTLVLLLVTVGWEGFIGWNRAFACEEGEGVRRKHGSLVSLREAIAVETISLKINLVSDKFGRVLSDSRAVNL